jgi:hypothetical protein
MYQVLHYQDPNPKVLFKFNSKMNKYEFFYTQTRSDQVTRNNFDMGRNQHQIRTNWS